MPAVVDPNLTTAMKILLLEDQSFVRSGMRSMLRLTNPGAEISEAADYDAAVELLAAQPFDLAFLDYNLRSDKTGLDVLRYIRENDCPTLAIMVSGEDDKDIVRSCLDAGACGYIPKGAPDDGPNQSGEEIFRTAIETVFRGCLYLPASVFGRGGHSPVAATRTQAVSVDSLRLSPRQVESLYYLCQGLSNKAIANRMNISESTVRKDYVSAIFRELGVARRTELIIEISRRGIAVPKPEEPGVA